MFSEATAAHPYSQRANIELGAHETGFLLGWIPASVSNDAADGAPTAAAIGGALLHEAERRPRAAGLRAGAPPRDHRPDAGAVRAARHAGRAAAPTPSWPAAPSCRSRSTRTTTSPCSPSASPGPTWRRRSRPSATTSSTAAASTRSTSTYRSRRRRPHSSPTTWSDSASPTPGSSPTAAPMATCCACSRCTGSRSRPTTSPSPPTTGANCSSTCWRTCLRPPEQADLPQAATSREARCEPTLRLTRWRALSTVLVSHSRRSAMAS